MSDLTETKGIWYAFPKQATRDILNCRYEQISNPRLGEGRIRVGSVTEGIVVFWFDNEDPNEPSSFCVLPRPRGY